MALARKSKKKLFEYLSNQKVPGFENAAELGLKHPMIVNETYGKDSCIYIKWESTHQRNKMERRLLLAGFIVNLDYSPESTTSEIRVSYFKGRNWDE